MHRLVPLVFLVGFFSGCIALEPETSGACREGPEPFVVGQHHPGFIGPEYQYMFYTLGRDGRLFYFRAHETDASGSGEVTPAAGALRNTTVLEVRKEMQAVGVTTAGRDLSVSRAYKDTVDPKLFDRFCGVVRDEFHTYKAEYQNNMIADCDGFTFKITTDKGTHKSYSYCNEGPDGVREAFDDIRDATWKKFKMEGL